MVSYFKLTGRQLKYWLSLGIASLVYVLPIILADRYYNDDLSRTITGATGWNGDGRPATELLMKLYSFGRPITDTFPLTILAGIGIFSYSVTLYMRENFMGGGTRLPGFSRFLQAFCC